VGDELGARRKASEVSDNLRDRIAAVQAKHLLVRYDRAAWWCQCGDDCLSVEGSHSRHVADAVIEALDDMGIIHLSKVRPSYADNLCRGGCDCSCCYGMYDEPCHCRDAICNCGGDRAAHGQKPLEDK
jgi:hypothetical protein